MPGCLVRPLKAMDASVQVSARVQVSETAAGPGWLAVGDAALAFDPKIAFMMLPKMLTLASAWLLPEPFGPQTYVRICDGSKTKPDFRRVCDRSRTCPGPKQAEGPKSAGCAWLPRSGGHGAYRLFLSSRHVIRLPPFAGAP